MSDEPIDAVPGQPSGLPRLVELDRRVAALEERWNAFWCAAEALRSVASVVNRGDFIKALCEWLRGDGESCLGNMPGMGALIADATRDDRLCAAKASTLGWLIRRFQQEWVELTRRLFGDPPTLGECIVDEYKPSFDAIGVRLHTIAEEMEQSAQDEADGRRQRDTTQRGDETLETRALQVLLAHPDWSNRQIAKEIGCHPKSLTRKRCPRLFAARAAYKGRDVPRGTKDSDGRIEAWNA